MQPLTSVEVRKLKAQAQLLDPMFKVGKAGLSEGFVKSVAEGLARHQLVKVKIGEFKEQKKTLGSALAEKTASHLIMRVGHVVVLYLPKVPAGTTMAST
jgi:RNA-binding protein